MSAITLNGIPKFLIFSVLCAGYVAADVTSLYIPGFDPQPVTANELGAGSDGYTTYVIAPGVTSGTLDDYGFYGPATLVVGASAAAVTYIDPDLGISVEENCQISGGLAVCNDVVAAPSSDGVDGYTMTATITETVAPFPIQIGGATSINPSPTSDSFASAETATASAIFTSVYSDLPSSTGSSDGQAGSGSGSMTTSFVSSPTGGASGSNSGSSTAPKSTSGAPKLVSFSFLSLFIAGSTAIYVFFG